MSDEMTSPSGDRIAELRDDPHVRQACERTLRILEVAEGLRDVSTLDDIVRDVAFCLAVLEANPDQLITYGHVVVQRGPMDGWSLWIRTADVYRMHLESFWKKEETTA